MNNGARIQKSAELLADLTNELQDLCSDFETVPQGLHTKYLGLFLVYTIRQVQAICILISNPAPFYAEQAGQLSRGLCEIYAKAAWMMQPDSESDRDQRAWRLEKSSIEREPLSERQRATLCTMIGIEAYESERSNLRRIPTTKKMLSRIGASDVYDLFRWESSAVHMSLITLATTVHQLDANTGRVTVGGPNQPVDRGKRLLLALDMLGRLASVVITGLGLNSENWRAAYVATFGEVMELLSPLVETETAR